MDVNKFIEPIENLPNDVDKVISYSSLIVYCEDLKKVIKFAENENPFHAMINQELLDDIHSCINEFETKIKNVIQFHTYAKQ